MGQFRGVELDDVELNGDHLRLRRWRPDDAAAVFEVMQHRSMHEFLALADPYTRADAERFVTATGHHGRGDGTGIGSAVVERETGRFVGSAALRVPDGGVGYWVAPSARGHGYAAQVARMLADWAFGHGLDRGYLHCDGRNLASVRTALSAGFHFEGVDRHVLTGSPVAALAAQHRDVARFARLASDPPDPVLPVFAPLPRAGLGDGVLGLRAMRAEDAAALAETDDELAVRWGFDGRPHSVEQARHTAAQAGLNWLVGRVATFAMIDLAGGEVAGVLNLRQAGPPQVGGVGYVVHPRFRGRGYTTRALRLLVSWAFETADFARLELGAKTANEASQRVAVAAGFEPDGVRRARLRNPDGTFSDEVRFALVNPKYGRRDEAAAEQDQVPRRIRP